VAVPSAFSWSCVFRPGTSNLDPQQDDHEEGHGHHDTEQPYCYAVFSEFAFLAGGFVLRLATDKAVDLLIGCFSGAISSVATLRSAKSVSP